jgi:hypothetical protein
MGVYGGVTNSWINISPSNSLSGIVTSGLVLALDAGRTLSYPGSGTTWTDLSGNGNTGTLTNGPTYSSANFGSIVFDGVDDVITFASNNIISGTQNFTVEAIVKSNNTASPDYIFGNYGVSNSNGLAIYFYLNKFYFWYGGITISNSTVLSNTWYIVAFTRSGNTTSIYINGVLDITGTNATSITTSLSYRIGNGPDYNSEIYAGNIASVKAYNRALTATEISQNYNALRRRFGI